MEIGLALRQMASEDRWKMINIIYIYINILVKEMVGEESNGGEERRREEEEKEPGANLEESEGPQKVTELHNIKSD